MHGRLKVKTSAQQAAEKQAARTQKMRVYQGAMNAILTHRLQHNEAQLKMTSGLLQVNPDITTLWNIRKEVLLHLVAECSDQDSKDALLRHDMDVSQDCLQTNPKSYGAWHHRCWCITQMSKPDWSRELNLCNKYLALDERNFHVWDYRRFVVSHSGISQKEELDYSTERINVNFSNYSAWHYRSKLLPQVFPSKNHESSGLMSEMKRREELDLVQNAAFTDPEDSSAWFYHKWLLMGGKSLDPDPVPVILKLERENTKLLLALSSPTDANKTCQLFVEGQKIELDQFRWQPAFAGEPTDTLWILQGVPFLSQAKTFSVRTEATDQEVSVSTDHPFWQTAVTKTSLEDKTEALLNEELENCSSLLEMEPDSKWTRYARILIMKAIDNEKYQQEILDEFDALAELDSKRKFYYLDMRSKQILEFQLKKAPELDLNLSDRGLTCLYFKERFVSAKNVNLSKNQLRSVDSLLPYLQSCKRLSLDENLIENISGFEPNSALQEVSIRRTPLAENLSAIQDLQAKCPSIKIVFE